jgi:thiamine transport system ATP-binding protein
MNALSLRGVCVEYDGTLAVRDVSLDLPQGEVLAVLGPSGCGKSTLLRAIAGLEPLSAGTIEFEGQDLARVPTYRRGFALMFQDGQLFSHLTVAGNVGYPLRLRHTPTGERTTRVGELLDLVGLGGYGHRDPATLSGGERQRVALARALAVRPRLLLLDEPLSALDGGMRERLAVELREILLGTGTTALCVTHDHDEAYTLADRLAVMRSGAMIQEGPIADVWQQPVDAETALFLGYARVVTGEPAALVLAAAQFLDAGEALTGSEPPAVALRRSALTVSPAGALRGIVTSARATPDVVRLTVQVAGAGELDAVAPLAATSAAGVAIPPPAVGAEVRLTVDPARLAVIPISLH